jgi:hypothetical protein
LILTTIIQTKQSSRHQSRYSRAIRWKLNSPEYYLSNPRLIYRFDDVSTWSTWAAFWPTIDAEDRKSSRRMRLHRSHFMGITFSLRKLRSSCCQSEPVSQYMHLKIPLFCRSLKWLNSRTGCRVWILHFVCEIFNTKGFFQTLILIKKCSSASKSTMNSLKSSAIWSVSY